MNEAIKRILAQHYGGNPAHPGFLKMLSRVQADPSAQDRGTQGFIQHMMQQGLLRS